MVRQTAWRHVGRRRRHCQYTESCWVSAMGWSAIHASILSTVRTSRAYRHSSKLRCFAIHSNCTTDVINESVSDFDANVALTLERLRVSVRGCWGSYHYRWSEPTNCGSEFIDPFIRFTVSFLSRAVVRCWMRAFLPYPGCLNCCDFINRNLQLFYI